MMRTQENVLFAGYWHLYLLDINSIFVCINNYDNVFLMPERNKMYKEKPKENKFLRLLEKMGMRGTSWEYLQGLVVINN